MGFDWCAYPERSEPAHTRSGGSVFDADAGPREFITLGIGTRPVFGCSDLIPLVALHIKKPVENLGVGATSGGAEAAEKV